MSDITKTPAAVAAELHAIADALATLAPDYPDLYASLTLSDSNAANLGDTAKRAVIDTLSLVVAGQHAAIGSKLSDGKLWYGARKYDAVSVTIYASVTDPAEVSEVERLRAELAEVRKAYAWAVNTTPTLTTATAPQGV